LGVLGSFFWFGRSSTVTSTVGFGASAPTVVATSTADPSPGPPSADSEQDIIPEPVAPAPEPSPMTVEEARAAWEATLATAEVMNIWSIGPKMKELDVAALSSDERANLGAIAARVETLKTEWDTMTKTHAAMAPGGARAKTQMDMSAFVGEVNSIFEALERATTPFAAE
jgi:hypothetical protein